VGKATPGDVSTAAARAVEAQHAWAAAPFEERARVLRRAGEVLDANADEINCQTVMIASPAVRPRSRSPLTCTFE
jgi:acyl-CoA reductase-like NAD-dependent aldehyde dehydrogenase